MAPEGMRVGGTQCEEPGDDWDADDDWTGSRILDQEDAGGAKVLQFRPRGSRR
jgi:hypothetical protein